MRFIAVIAGVLFILFGLTYWVAFTESGNKMLIPYIESKASEALKAPVKISIFRLTPSTLSLDAVYQESIHVKTEGGLSILSKSFDLDYAIEADGIRTPQISINEPISLRGNVVGDLKDMSIKGVGVIFEAPANYDVQLQGGLLSRAVAKVENLSVQKVLGLVNQPIVAYGRGDLHVNISDNGGTPSGDAKIQIHDGRLDEKMVLEAYGVELPPNVSYQANLDASLQGTKVAAKGVIESSLAKLLIDNGLFDTGSQTWKGDYELIVPNLSAIQKLARVPLQGQILVVGEASGDAKGIQARARTESLGGKIEAIYQGDKAYLMGEKVELDKVLYTLVQPLFASGAIGFDIQMDSIEKKKGKASLSIPSGQFLGEGMKALTGMQWPKSTAFELKSNALIDDKIINYDANFESKLASIRDIKGEFDSDEMATQTPFSLHVNELSDLAFATGRALKGPMQMVGVFKLSQGIPYVEANSEVLGGKSVIVYENSIASLKANNFSMQRLSEVVDFPYVFDALGDANATYDTVQKQGEFSLLLPKGHLRQSELVNLVRTLTGFDLVQETYTDTTLKGVIKDQMLGFNVALQGEQSFLKIEQGSLNLEASTINAPFALKVQNKDLSGVIKGPIGEPKISIKASEYIKKKIGKELEKHVPKGSGGAVKELLKLFKTNYKGG